MASTETLGIDQDVPQKESWRFQSNKALDLFEIWRTKNEASDTDQSQNIVNSMHDPTKYCWGLWVKKYIKHYKWSKGMDVGGFSSKIMKGEECQFFI